MKAVIYLPHVSVSQVSVGKEYKRNAEVGNKHIWQNRVFDLTNAKDIADFNAAAAKLCDKHTIHQFVPRPFILPLPPATDTVEIPDLTKLTDEQETTLLTWAQERLKAAKAPKQDKGGTSAGSGTGPSAGGGSPTGGATGTGGTPAPSGSSPSSAPSAVPSPWTTYPVAEGTVAAGFAIKRADTHGETGRNLFRGIEDCWTESLPPDPFPTEAEAQAVIDAHAPKPATAPSTPKPAKPKGKNKAKPKAKPPKQK
jgi:hypothetical protein